jgi:hypothetical protein
LEKKTEKTEKIIKGKKNRNRRFLFSLQMEKK